MEGWKCTLTAKAEIPLLCFCAIPHNLTTSDLIPNEFNPCLSILFHFVQCCAAFPHNVTTSDLIYNEFDLFLTILFHFVPFCAAIPHNLRIVQFLFSRFLSIFFLHCPILCCDCTQLHKRRLDL